MPVFGCCKEFRDNVTANNEISKSSTDFTFGGDALQKDFEIFQTGTYRLGVTYQWRHFEKDVLHNTRVRVDGAVNTDLNTLQYMGGDQGDSDARMATDIWTLVDLTPDTYDIDFQFASNEVGKTVYLYYRRLYLERYD